MLFTAIPALAGLADKMDRPLTRALTLKVIMVGVLAQVLRELVTEVSALSGVLVGRSHRRIQGICNA